MYNREKTVSSVNSLGKTGHLPSKELNWLLSHTIHRSQNGLKKSYVRPQITKLL